MEDICEIIDNEPRLAIDVGYLGVVRLMGGECRRERVRG